MKKNMGLFDRIFRVSVAILFATLYFSGTVTGPWGMVLLVFGVVFVLTSLVGYCPLYSLLGIQTCSKTKM